VGHKIAERQPHITGLRGNAAFQPPAPRADAPVAARVVIVASTSSRAKRRNEKILVSGSRAGILMGQDEHARIPSLLSYQQPKNCM
jgi:hypothetical protein